MTRNQLETLMRGFAATVPTFPQRVLLFIVALILKATTVTPGVPTVAAPAAPTTATGMAAIIQALTPGNGYKLEFRQAMIRLLVKLILRYGTPPVLDPGSNSGGVQRVIARFGQSNALDKAVTSEGAQEPLLNGIPNLNNPWNNLLILNPHTGNLVPVQNGVTDLSASDPTDCYNGVPFAPTRGIFAGALAARLKALFPTETFVMVKESHDGQSLNTFLGAATNARLAQAKAAVEASGKTWKLSAIALQIGETDFAQGNAWAPLADQFEADRIASGFADTETLFLVSGIYDIDHNGNRDAYNQQIMDWCAAKPATRKFLTPAGWQGIAGDELHLDAVTQAQIGHKQVPNALFGTSGGFTISTTTSGGTGNGTETYAADFQGGSLLYGASSAAALNGDFAVEFRAKRGRINDSYLLDFLTGSASRLAILANFTAGVYEVFSELHGGTVTRTPWPIQADVFKTYRLEATGGVGKLLVDGQQVVAAFPCALPNVASAALNIAYRASAPNFQGIIDYIRVENGAGNPVLWLKFEQDLADSAGNFPTLANAANIVYVAN